MPGDPMNYASRAKLTYADFLHFPDDGRRHELIDGEHYVTPAPDVSHQHVLGTLYRLIANWLDEHPIGEAFLSPLDVVLSEFDVVEPDLLYICGDRAANILTTQHLRGAPDLVVEIASPSTWKRDETIKFTLYERAGVAEYWTVAPHARSMRVYRRQGDRFTAPLELSVAAGDTLASPLLPGFSVPLERLFRK